MIQTDSDLLSAALAHLAAAGVSAVTVPGGAGDEPDALIQLRHGDRARDYEVHLKNRVSPASVPLTRPHPGRQVLLVTPHISERVGESLRQRDVHYVDAAGNMYLRWEGLLLDVRGRKGPTAAQPGTPGRPLRTFQPSGLRIVFALLSDPDLIGAPYREIARTGGVSIGTVHRVVNELENAGYATTNPRRLYRTRNLLDRWVEAYIFDMWPRLTMARFDAADPDWWRAADDALRAAGAQWGGETAAHRLNPRLRPQRAVVYAPTVPTSLAREFRFRKADGEGGVEIRHRFWTPPEATSLTVPTPLIYADLIASADPRLAEAATDLRSHDELLGRLDRG